MRIVSSVAGLMLISALSVTLAACGNAPQELAPSAAQLASAGAYQPSVGAFTAVPTALLQSSKPVTTTDCNLDSIDGKPAGSEPLQHTGSVMFAGWAGDSGSGTVPAVVQLVLTGAEDYAVSAATGALRKDVAAAMHKAGLATAGFEANADLSAVAPGEYGVTLLYSLAGKNQKCVIKVKLSVQ